MEAPSSMPCKAAEQSDLITTDAALGAAAAGWGAVVGVDTEFVRERTFHPIAALYQIAGGAGVCLVDARAAQSFAALKALFADPKRIKVMHSCSEDLEVVDRHLGVAPVAIVDTQLAHAFLHPELSIGYAGLVEAHLGVSLDKRETRSNWLLRPLSAEQLAYASEDAAHLPRIWARLAAALDETGRARWFAEEMATRLRRPEPAPLECYRVIKGARRLAPSQLAVLRRLAAWREVEARRRDRPRGRIVTDAELLSLARTASPPRDAAFAVLSERVARRYAGDIAKAQARGLADAPPPPLPGPLSSRQGEALKALREFAGGRAEALGMAPGLLANKRLWVDFVRSGATTAAGLGWRAEALGEGLANVLRALRR